jgi:hypothetical protein
MKRILAAILIAAAAVATGGAVAASGTATPVASAPATHLYG